MAGLPSTDQVEAWLTAHGWYRGRDIGPRADALIAIRVHDSERQGRRIDPVPPAVAFLHSFGELRLPYPARTRTSLVTTPTIGWEGDAFAIQELAERLGRRLFPVGHESADGAIVLVDEAGRFFSLHQRGSHYLGAGATEAFAVRLSGRPCRAAEDHSARQ